MNDPERQEFFPPTLGIFGIFLLSLLFLAASASVLAPGLLLLGFREFPFADTYIKLFFPDGWDKFAGTIAMAPGLIIMILLLWAIWKDASGWRPILVVDNEGVFYQPHGEAIIPWRDIRAVEFDTRKRGDWFDRDDERLFLIRHGGSPVQILGVGTSAYRAIAQAWERHGRKA